MTYAIIVSILLILVVAAFIWRELARRQNQKVEEARAKVKAATAVENQAKMELKQNEDFQDDIARPASSMSGSDIAAALREQNKRVARSRKRN